MYMIISRQSRVPVSQSLHDEVLGSILRDASYRLSSSSMVLLSSKYFAAWRRNKQGHCQWCTVHEDEESLVLDDQDDNWAENKVGFYMDMKWRIYDLLHSSI